VELEPSSTIPAHDRSWWEEPVAASAKAEPEATEPETNEPDQPTGLSESFLDRVFSQLGEDPEGQSAEPTEPKDEPSPLGHGFLKRRRMSSVGLDDV
jgi:hypothetical protein